MVWAGIQTEEKTVGNMGADQRKWSETTHLAVKSSRHSEPAIG